MKIETNAKSLKLIYIILIILLASPSLIYILMGNSILNYNSDFLYIRNILKINSIIDGSLFLDIFALISIIYLILLKNYKTILKNGIFKYILIISALFSFILPMTSTDIFYYIGTGWSEAKYGVNPYYTSVYELKEVQNINDDEILNKMPSVWCKQTIVYGPIWPLVCRILTLLSFGSLPLALIIFKIFNLTLHLLNCKIIQKLSNKKLITLIYGLNPLVLFESLTNVHNDIFLIFFILLALYLAIKKKKIILSIMCFAIATAIKYVAILIVPFVVIYYYRKENLLKRILKAIVLALIFILTLGACYVLYTRNLQVLQGILIQQGKYAKSLLLCIYLFVNPKTADICSLIFMGIFILLYLSEMFRYLWKKEITLKENLRITYTLIFVFLFLTITNFQTWYIMWLIPLIIWQNKKTIKSTINLTISAELACTVFFILGEGYVYGKYYWIIMMMAWLIFNKIKPRSGGCKNGKISINRWK